MTEQELKQGFIETLCEEFFNRGVNKRIEQIPFIDFLKPMLDEFLADLEQIKQEIACPFCNEDDFDKIGLKNHLIKHCEVYPQIETL